MKEKRRKENSYQNAIKKANSSNSLQFSPAQCDRQTFVYSRWKTCGYTQAYKMDGEERGEGRKRTKRWIRKNCDDAFNVNNFRLRFYFLITESRRASGSGTRRQPSLTRQASAWIRHSRHFLRSSHYQDCVCVRVRAYNMCVRAFRLFSLRYVFYHASPT